MTKHLRKMIMNRSRYKNAYIKNKTVDNWERYRKLRNKCVKLTKKVKIEYFRNINIQSIIDNKKFWKTIKPNFANKNKTHKIILVEGGEIICDNTKTADVFNDYFVNIVKVLDIPEITHSKKSETSNIIHNDHVDNIIHIYVNHPSILRIRENVNQIELLSFSKINERQMETEINSLNPKKSTWNGWHTR